MCVLTRKSRKRQEGGTRYKYSAHLRESGLDEPFPVCTGGQAPRGRTASEGAWKTGHSREGGNPVPECGFTQGVLKRCNEVMKYVAESALVGVRSRGGC